MRAVQIVIRDMPGSTALEQHIRQKAQKLSQFCKHIHHIHVAIEIPQKHKHNGKLFRVCIDLKVPGKELVVNHNLSEDVYVAIRDAFQAILRQLESYTRIRRGDVKSHECANFGYVSKMFPEEAYGFIQCVDGHEYYFSISNVYYPNFEQLAIGDMVQFIGATGTEGRQAHRVTKEKKASYSEEVD